uniref:Uncharacterized protein n=1 Tax=viral metagenome TaxID=1070528 RepID=A0A6C0E7C3_9ZZZZ
MNSDKIYLIITSDCEEYTMPIVPVDGAKKYKTGLNVYPKSSSPHDKFVYTNKNSVHTSYTKWSAWIRIVIIPSNQKELCKCGNNKSCGAVRQIILSKRYPLYDLKTIKKFNLKITADYISYACKLGKIDILEWWKNSGLPLEYDSDAIKYASYYSHINILEWWKTSGLPLKYSDEPLNHAIAYNDSKVVNWWKKSGLKLKYDMGFLYMTGNIYKLPV